MTDHTGRFAVAIGLAGAAGALEGGLHTNIPVLVEHHSLELALKLAAFFDCEVEALFHPNFDEGDFQVEADDAE